MPQRTFKPIFERSLKELDQLLAPVIEQVKAANLEKGLYNSYRGQALHRNGPFYTRIRGPERTGQGRCCNRPNDHDPPVIQIKKSQLYVFAGANGAGKSTLYQRLSPV